MSILSRLFHRGEARAGSAARTPTPMSPLELFRKATSGELSCPECGASDMAVESVEMEAAADGGTLGAKVRVRCRGCRAEMAADAANVTATANPAHAPPAAPSDEIIASPVEVGPPSHASVDVDALLRQLGRRDLLGTHPAFAELKAQGERAVPGLLRILDGNDIEAAEDAIGLLAEIGAAEAVPRLRDLARSQWAEISRAALTALATIGKAEGTGLRLERHRVRGQVGELWTAVIQGRSTLYTPEEVIAFCRATITAMPELRFDSKNDEARTWGMVGWLLYRSLHPGWSGSWSEAVEPCAEAKRCFEEANRAEADDWWKSKADAIPEPAS